MIGRDEEVALLNSLLAASRSGQGNAIIVHGEAGIGKTALLAHIATGTSADPAVLRATGVEAEAELPFAALHLLLRPAAHLVTRLPPAQRQALRSAFGEAVPGGEGQSGASGAPDRFLVGLAVLTLLADLAEERPLICLIDDVQWLDRASADALLFAARRLAAERITMIFAGRDGTEQIVQGLPELRLRALARDECDRLLATQAAALSPEARARVIAEAEGNPLALLHFAAGLTDDQRAGHLAPLPLTEPGSPLAGRLERSLRAAIRRLPDRTRLVLLVAAADGSGSLPLVLRAARTLGAAPDDLAPGEHAALVEVADGRIRFRHPLIKAAAYQEAPVAQRAAAHRALAGVLVNEGQADRRAWHLSAATLEPDEEISVILADTGDRARARGSTTAAATAYERAAQLTVDRERRARWLAAAAEAALAAGQLSRAAAAAGRGERLTSDPLMSARLAAVRAAVDADEGDPEQAARRFADAAEAVAGLSPDDAVSLMAMAAGEAWFAGDHAVLGRAAQLVTALGDAAIAPELRPVASAVRGMERVAAHDPATGLPLLTAAIPPALGRAHPPVVAQDLDRPPVTGPHAPTALADRGPGHRGPRSPGPRSPGSRSQVSPGGLAGDQVASTYAVFSALMTGDDEAARAAAAAQVAACRSQGLVTVLPHALQLLAQAQILGGEHAEAAESGAEAWSIAHDTGQAVRLRHLHGVLARLAAIRGEDDRCAELARLAEGAAQERFGSGWGGSALVLLDLVRARYAAAADRMARMLDGPLGHTVIALFAIADHVEACARLDDPGRAALAFARFDAWSEASGQAWAQAVVHRCRALMAPRDSAEELYASALELHERGGRPFERARTQLVYGEWLRRARRRADAGTQLRAAAGGFAALGAAPWAERARAELAAAGGAAAEGETRTAAALTPQELQVVRLAAAGATNRQIGAQLFLSPRTVGFHLYKAYPKLGVSSRGELARLDL
ncbi:helix-turn-helix transcriptional regulator [Nonomuraea soli]|uniref:DNA-binding CsgD family transcriptional regulator/tetratricopeptide (TPR) repeat protein n=1 Tax=Nonomuraea soli TaxID=1032476 RepID=A0A7W0CLL0_9ACTN|nr:LuxR family transcriptional regulator [Nonomuraea soli]MBA2893451.1 DNA-binding CsgD family transcriptional regulator/tetratricopeptide (TPR) repeat protein [Nonomuraea soli]